MGEDRLGVEEWYVDRRAFLGTASAAGGVVATGRATAQDDGDQSGVNVDPDSSVTGSESVDLGTDTSVAALGEFFVEYPSSDHPVVGQTARLGGIVVNRIRTPGEATTFTESFDYGDFRPDDGTTLGSLVEPLAMLEDGEPSYEGLVADADSASAFFESYDLVRLVGVTDRDQRFYSRYDYVPTLWLVVESDTLDSDRGRVDVSGRVRYAGGDGPAGAYFEVEAVDEGETESTLGPSTEVGRPVTVVGIQHQDERVLTTGDVDITYSASEGIPRADGGSLVLQTGQVTALNFDDEPATVELDRSTQDILLGDTRVEGGRDRPASNTVAVLDRSGSMTRTDTRTGITRLQVAKQSARGLINFVETDNRLGVVTFSSDSRIVSYLTRLGPGSRSGVTGAVDGIRAEGSTSIGAGLIRAVTFLEDTDGPKSIILLSDGQQNTAPTPDEVLPRLKSLGVTVYTIGMGSGADRTLLRRIAEETGGEMQYRPEPGEVRELFQSFSASIQQRATLNRRAHRLTDGESASGTAVVDDSVDAAQFSLIYPGSEITVTPQRPDGSTLSASDAGVSRRVGEANEVWTVDEPATGEWGYTVTAEQLPQPEVANVQVSAASPVQARLLVSDLRYQQTGMYRIELKVTDGEGRYPGAGVTLTATNGDRTERLTLRDDRGGPDPVADDGIYTGYFHPPSTGRWTLRAAIDGGRIDGLQREVSRTLQVESVAETTVQPYERRSSVVSGESPTATPPGTDAGDSSTDGGTLGGLVPLAGAAAIVLAVGAGVVRKLMHDGDDEATQDE